LTFIVEPDMAELEIATYKALVPNWIVAPDSTCKVIVAVLSKSIFGILPGCLKIALLGYIIMFAIQIVLLSYKYNESLLFPKRILQLINIFN
jgi:hypothetical protein